MPPGDEWAVAPTFNKLDRALSVIELTECLELHIGGIEQVLWRAWADFGERVNRL